MRRSALFWGVIIILLGILFLLQNLGILTVDVWAIILPTFIIALGIWILWGSLSRRSVKLDHIDVPRNGANQANLKIRHGAGRLLIGPNQTNDSLIMGDCSGGAELNTQRIGDTLQITLSAMERSFPFIWGPEDRLDWDVKLAPAIPFSISVDSGAAESRIDLSQLLVSQLRLNSGASSNYVTLPANAGLTTANFKTGAASLEIRIPAGVAGRIRTSGGLSSITVDRQRFPRTGDYYQSADYDSAANRVDIRVDTGVGSVGIR